jgi:hypothetical protein
MTALDDRRAVARSVFASLDGTPPLALRMFSKALALSGGPLGAVAESFDSFADSVEFANVTGDLAELELAHGLRFAARHPGLPDLLDRLEGVESPPWPQLAAALRAEREAA